MTERRNLRGPIRFGVFDVDLAARELRKSGVRIRLQEKPFRLLVALLARSGEVVTRAELQQELWPTDEYGEFDHGLNTAVMKLRQTLGDSALNPRFIETIPKVGYRFLGTVDGSVGSDAMPPTLPWKRRLTFAVGGLLIAVVVVAATL